jgi:hypothetical protein
MMRRALISWTIGFALLIVAFVATLAILNGTIYSAHGFVENYLNALNRHDAATARELPGVGAPSDAATDLLTDGALGTITSIHLLHDTGNTAGSHTVTFSYRLGATRQSTSFSVAQTSSFLGLFTRWTFTKSPLATVSVEVLHDTRFRANGLDVTATHTKTGTASYMVFTPGLYTFDHKSTYLVASPVGVPITEPGSVTPVQVNVQANARFVKDVRSELDKYLTSCATQKVLLPTACPFGKSFDNRVVSTPAWAMKTYPKITIVPDANMGKWLVPNTNAVAHLKVRVQSLFDGSLSTFNKDVSFPISYRISIGPDNHLTITSLYG